MTLPMDSNAAYWAERAELAEAERDELMKLASAVALWKWKDDPTEASDYIVVDAFDALPAALLAKVKGGEG